MSDVGWFIVTQRRRAKPEHFDAARAGRIQHCQGGAVAHPERLAHVRLRITRSASSALSTCLGQTVFEPGQVEFDQRSGIHSA